MLNLTTGSVSSKYHPDLKASAFLNIPYAVPPIDDRRFEYAQLLTDRWNGTRDGSEYGPACMSNTSITNSPQYVISEDCLTLNIFISDYCLTSSDGCAGIFYLHGGGFHHDSPRMYDERFLIENFATRNVVLVTVAYRLNTFGMFYLPDDDTYTGNYYFSDILVALQWCHREAKNIHIDIDRMTLMGHSTGGRGVNLLTNNPIFDDYYKRVIIMSMAAPLPERNTGLQDSYDISMKVNCANSSDFIQLTKTRRQEIIDCMKKLPAKTINDANRLLEDEDGKQPPSMPRIDKKFITDDIAVLRSKRKARDYLIGTTAAEMANYNLDFTLKEMYLMNVAAAYRLASRYHPVYNRTSMIASKLLADEYIKCYGDMAINNITTDEFHLASYEDIMAMANIDRNNNNEYKTYLYSFDFPMTPGLGTVHAQDLDLVMGRFHDKYTAPKYQFIRNKYMDYFTNFAKTAIPDDNWNAFTGHNYYSIDTVSENQLLFHKDAINWLYYALPSIIKSSDEEISLLS